ncbi:hypothetical protein HF521_014928 [Silurus meridionalis]|uniref:Uncharacterized protein n=1 Tax=Silurus meridionalis TaxID=175797 RepID=A0A8T0AB62_SILME|nr:hypothetical protein HF521_014928 [Silurus meridionalis]
MLGLRVSSFVFFMFVFVVETTANERPYAVLQNQNLVLLISVLAVLLVAVIVMAVCVYKPLRARTVASSAHGFHGAEARMRNGRVDDGPDITI